MRPSYEQLEERLRFAHARLAEMSGANLTADIKAAAGLSRQQARVLAILYSSPGTVSVGLIWTETMQQNNGDGPTLEAVKVRVSQIRKCLRDLGVCPSIVNEWGFGYRLTDEARGWLAERLARRAAA
ncbi:helix-turn-helix domain-containing protein [Brevundimonas olei]|uniref:Helix-turn-helix domain-containing protein n=1 Tax=Brevundimonas olei TaxID=657642 RepID=A0ABZ2IG14_9CAUL